MYMPLQNTCMTVTSTSAKPSLDELYAIRTKDQIAPGTRERRHDRGDLGGDGQDRVEARAARGHRRRSMATGGGLLFGGDANGHFRAFDQETGKVLWDVNLGSHGHGLSRSPMR